MIRSLAGRTVLFAFLGMTGVSLGQYIEEALNLPDCSDGLDNDGDGLIDYVGGDPGCANAVDADEFDRTDDFDTSRKALIVYNTNTPDGATIADYYRVARGLDPAMVCPAPFPPGSVATAEELQGARRVILEDCLCQNVLNRLPSECAGITAASLAAVSPASHLVLIKGVPERLTGTTWPTDAEEPSLDYYLSWLIYHDEPIFDGADGWTGNLDYAFIYDGSRPDEVDHQPSDSVRGSLRPVVPALEQTLAYGRVEALDTPRTLALIDRTLAAEQAGFQGNLFVQGDPSTLDFLRDLSSSFDETGSCSTYAGDPEQEWPHDECRTGTTADGLIPGEPSRDGLVQSLPYPVNAGLYLGRGLPPGGHDAFRGFDNMLNWRRHHPDQEVVPCRPLCSDYDTQPEQIACQAASTDVFAEIDTRCVGVAPGFMGWQFRSWPVQYFGFQPPGWTLDPGGAREKTLPRVLSGSPYGNAYLRFGALDALTDPICLRDDPGGLTPIPCPERLHVSLNSEVVLDTRDSGVSFGYRFRYRRGGGTTGQLRVEIDFRRDDGTVFPVTDTVDLSLPQVDWTQVSGTLTVPGKGAPLVSAELRLASTLDDDLRGWLDVDHVEFFRLDEPGQPNLLPPDAASFERPFLGPTQAGDWAAHAIDRLGGIAWWGSASHHLTPGSAFRDADQFAGAFFGGRTLGEALLYIGSGGRAGIIYGDPLYRPSGARIYLDEGLPDPQGRYRLVGDDPTTRIPGTHTLYVDAFHGQGNLALTEWSVSVCPGVDVGHCRGAGLFTPVESSADHQVHGVVGHPLSLIPADLFDPMSDDQDRDVILRLRVWNPNQEQDDASGETHLADLTSYAFVHWDAVANNPPRALNVRIVPAQPEEQDALYALYTFYDVEGDSEYQSQRTVRWFKNGVHQQSLDDLVILSAARTGLGDRWNFSLTVFDGSAHSEPVMSPPVFVGCDGPTEALTFVGATLQPGGAVQFDVQDANVPAFVSGYNLYRGLQPDDVALLQSDAADSDSQAPGVQLIDAAPTAEPAFYLVRAFNNTCAAESP